MYDTHEEATNKLLQNALAYSRCEATGRDVSAAAYRLVATRLRDQSRHDLAEELERTADLLDRSGLAVSPTPPTPSPRTPPTSLTIRVRRRSDDVHASLEGQPGVWGCGPGTDAAIGSLVRTNRTMFGVQISND